MTDTKKDSAKRPCVYMLRCKGGSLYTGWTNDFEKRLAAHQSGKGAKYTRSHLPVEPVYLEYLPDKIAATRREAEIKKLRWNPGAMNFAGRNSEKAAEDVSPQPLFDRYFMCFMPVLCPELCTAADLHRPAFHCK